MESLSPPGVGPAWVEVDESAIAANVAVLCEHARTAGAGQVMAVVKADGYGHGLIRSARAALTGGATWLGVALLSEALQLREAGVSAPVLSWLHAPGDDFATAVRQGVDLGVSHPWALAAIADAARAVARTARIHLKVDTGLGRNGAYLSAIGSGGGWATLVEAARRASGEAPVRVVGVFSHFAYADEPDHPTVRAQQRAFETAVADCERAGFPLEVRHLANSAATLTNPSAAYDLVRPGLAVYGLSPVPDRAVPSELGLRPAMTLAARVSQVKELPAGQGISYGHRYAPSADTAIALLPVGYADGVPRAGTNVGPVSLGGRRHTVAGRVCMDQIVVDIGLGGGVVEGDVAVLFGPGDHGGPTAQDWAQATGTISYEIVTRVSHRLPRVYGGQR